MARQNALEKFLGSRAETVLSSRTDAGVHATENAFHVDIDRRDRHGQPVVRTALQSALSVALISAESRNAALCSMDLVLSQEPHSATTVAKALNAFLKRTGVRVTETYEVPSNFSARFVARY